MEYITPSEYAQMAANEAHAAARRAKADTADLASRVAALEKAVNEIIAFLKSVHSNP